MRFFQGGDRERAEENFLPLPVVVKPAREGSTIGVSIVRKEEELVPALKKAANVMRRYWSRNL